ncbi:SMP-30/gluconolactonase/LRE family protein [Herbiconiux sp. CPCC 203407]|uniref:SMP-30/gluconolactonase/LRE family protein n=1 Tax=Herbiconiux oxytropis TaxID=2970915 RepID=A0AA41XEC7_9MICO|nr:SMP-30/gluconolactonase/LRE family protein [Herbiconiux oxytropis]MCS5720770.1 SMP-30/gluconolactonase/LRE family protein [Herbiconiux oxytropis]MCS5724903.1 SMP-30/gluconolactonase/LRE family protein [Herbiconiux oxytropis]
MAATTAGLRLLADDLVWAESPCWDDGRLWVSDTQGSRLFLLTGDDTVIHTLDSPINGTGILPSGELVGARMTGARLDSFDGERWSLHAELSGWVTGTLGDLIVLPDGTVLVDEVRGPDRPGRLLRIAPDGATPIVSVAADDLVFPNGLVVVDEGRTLVVAETYAHRLTAFTLGPNGELTDRRLWFDLRAELGDDFRPDGACVAADGSVWVATTSGNAFIRVADGALVDRIDVDGFAIACCLGAGDDLILTSATSRDPELSVTDAAHRQRTRARVSALHHPTTVNPTTDNPQ